MAINWVNPQSCLPLCLVTAQLLIAAISAEFIARLYRVMYGTNLLLKRLFEEYDNKAKKFKRFLLNPYLKLTYIYCHLMC